MDIDTKTAALILGRSRSRVIQLCRGGKVEGAYKLGRDWAIPLPLKVHRRPPGRPRVSSQKGRQRLPAGQVGTNAGLTGELLEVKAPAWRKWPPPRILLPGPKRLVR